MKWPLGNGGVTYLRGVTDTVQTVQYSDSQCTVHVYTATSQKTSHQIFKTTKTITFDLSLVDIIIS